MKRVSITIFIILLILANSAFAGNVFGTVSHAKNKKPAAHALVKFILNKKEVARTVTGDDGKYFVRNISAGTYTVKISYKKVTKEFRNVVIGPSGGTFNFKI